MDRHNTSNSKRHSSPVSKQGSPGEEFIINIASVPDDWESLTTIGQAITKEQDGFRWALGDLAIRVDKKYGDGSLKKFATEIRMPKAATLYDYHRAAKFYEVSARSDFPLLSWSHYRAAMLCNIPEKALEWLGAASDHDWPVAVMSQAIKKALGKPVPPIREVFEAQAVRQAGNGMLLLAMREADLVRMAITNHPDATITVVVSYAAKEPTNGD